MRVVLIIPETTPPTGGNAVTALRIAEELRAAGVAASVARYHRGAWPAAEVYHVLNATQVPRLLALGLDPARMAVTWTGTDIWQQWAEQPTRLRQQLDAVSAHTVFSESARRFLLERAPHWAPRLTVVPPAVEAWFAQPAPPHPLARRWPAPLLLQAGGIRPVKGNARGIELVEAARQAGVAWHYAMVGPVRDRGEWQAVCRLARQRPWVHLVGEVERRQMPQWYAAATAVVNTSRVEGVSNTLMEAMAAGRPILAADIAGNRDLLRDGQDGRIFADVQQFREILTQWARRPGLRERLGLAAQRRAAGWSARSEALAYLEVYRRLTAYRPSPAGSGSG